MKFINYILMMTIALASSKLVAQPGSFIIDDYNKAVWVDFKSAQYDVTFDIKTKSASAISIIKFETSETGFPIMDFVEPASEVYINNQPSPHEEITLPNGSSKIKVLQTEVKPGVHTAIIKTPITTGVNFHEQTVESIFSFLDMRDRYFLERYLPSNFEYDNYSMTINVSIINSQDLHQIFTNGQTQKLDRNKFSVSFPDHFTSSSLFFHIAPKDKYHVLETNYKSIDNRIIPVTMYSKELKLSRQNHETNTNLSVFHSRLIGNFLIPGLLPKLEKSYGPWPHESLVLFVKNKLKGGMEYVGAAETSHGAFKHELIHNYFGRAVLPVDGNAGWIDEAIASWNDYKLLIKAQKRLYILKKNWRKQNTNHYYKIKFFQSKLSEEGLVHEDHDHYQRHTNKKSYKQGRYLVAYLDYLMQKHTRKEKCMKSFLRYFFEKNKFKKIHSRTFQQDLEDYTGMDFDHIFNKYIYQN